MTLLEMLLAMSLISVVAVAFTSVLASVQRSVEVQMDRSNDNDQARLAVIQLDKEIRSGNVLYDPALEADPRYTLRIYTQANANIRSPVNRCVQWRILDERLERRDWSVADPAGSVSPWRVVAENIVNRTATELAPDGSVVQGVPAFELDDDPDKGSRLVNVTILARTDRSSGTPARIEVSVSGRNTSYGYPLDVCDVIPPG